MKSEAQFKVVFKNSVRKQKGCSISLAAPVSPGIPDLYVILPNYMPILLEAKWLGTVPDRKFKRKIQYSPMQLSYANHINAVQPHAVMGLVGLIYKKEIYAVLTPVNPTKNELSSEFFEDYNKVTRQDGRFDVLSLFQNSPIPVLEKHYNEVSLAEYIERTVGVTDIIRGTESPINTK